MEADCKAETESPIKKRHIELENSIGVLGSIIKALTGRLKDILVAQPSEKETQEKVTEPAHCNSAMEATIYQMNCRINGEIGNLQDIIDRLTI